MGSIGMEYGEIISIAKGMLDDVAEYRNNIQLLYNKLDEARDMWKGVDNNAFTNQVINSRPTLLDIGQKVENHANFLINDTNRRRGLQGDTASRAKNLGE